MISLYPAAYDEGVSDTANAEDVHEFLELSVPFDTWWRRLLEYEFIEEDNKDGMNIKSMLLESNRNFYDLPLYLVKQIALIHKTDKALLLYNFIVDYERNILNAQPRF